MSISQSTIKFISSLQRKKVRQNYHKFTVEGTKIVAELLLQKRYVISEIYATEFWYDNQGDNPLDYRSSKANISAGAGSEIMISNAPADWHQQPAFHLITERDLKRISGLSTPNQVLAVVEMPNETFATPATHGTHASLNRIAESWSIYLDGLQQPANLGAILRVADWFGFQNVFAGPGTVDLYNPKSIQATMGCFLRLNYAEETLETIKEANPDVPVFAADLQGQSIREFTPPPGGILIIGNEGKGISDTSRHLVDEYLLIPKAPGRQAESLNAAVAAGILCAWLGG